MMRCREISGWVNYTTTRYGRVMHIDTVPVTPITEQIPYPHHLGFDCPCNPKVEIQDDSTLLIIHDHAWAQEASA
jgi:hypothetical protein